MIAVLLDKRESNTSSTGFLLLGVFSSVLVNINQIAPDKIDLLWDSGSVIQLISSNVSSDRICPISRLAEQWILAECNCF